MSNAFFDIPVAIFIFKRDKAVDVVRRIGEVRPKKLYILADNGRNEEECRLAAECRASVEAAIDWDCEIVKNYAEQNRGVYQNIAEGAKWVLRQEKSAIFLEDDNLPEPTFFEFCRTMLERYENDERILWICGTNYLGDYKPKNGESYVFTRHMLPCGWASWAHKFEKYYCGDLALVEDGEVMDRVKRAYLNKPIYRQYKENWMGEYERIKAGKRPISWDYQMDFTIKAYNLFGVCPVKNQIKNIGADEFSVHGGNSMSMLMTKRFCGMSSYPLDMPLKHPTEIRVDKKFEKKIGKIILYPFLFRVRIAISNLVKRILRVPKGKSLGKYIRDGFK